MILKRPTSKVAAIFLLAILVLGALYVTIHKRVPNRISAPFVISPGGEHLAMVIGPLQRNGAYPGAEPTERQAYVLKLRKAHPQAIRVAKSRPVMAMAWRPGALSPELFAATFRLGHDRLPRIFAVTVSDDVSMIFSKILPDNLRISRMTWNPSGQVLAAVVLNDKGVYLGISCDNGRNFTITDIAISGGRVIWTDDETLYVQHGNDILELDVVDGNPQVMRTLVSAEGIYLSCSLYGRVVYRLGTEIYCGDQLLYKASQKIRQVIADGPYIAFKAGSHICVLDEKGNVKNKKNVGDDKYTALIALSSAHKFVYLIKNFQYIERYSFADSNEISTVYEVMD